MGEGIRYLIEHQVDLSGYQILHRGTGPAIGHKLKAGARGAVE
jgi:hypothetical protein